MWKRNFGLWACCFLSLEWPHLLSPWYLTRIIIIIISHTHGEFAMLFDTSSKLWGGSHDPQCTDEETEAWREVTESGRGGAEAECLRTGAFHSHKYVSSSKFQFRCQLQEALLFPCSTTCCYVGLRNSLCTVLVQPSSFSVFPTSLGSLSKVSSMLCF